MHEARSLEENEEKERKKIRKRLSGPQDEFISNKKRELMTLQDKEVAYT